MQQLTTSGCLTLQDFKWKICLANSWAMAAAKIEHSDLLEHQTSIVEQFREFWMEDHLCDVVLESSDGAKHRAHAAVLSAASMFFKIFWADPFWKQTACNEDNQ